MWHEKFRGTSSFNIGRHCFYCRFRGTRIIWGVLFLLALYSDVRRRYPVHLRPNRLCVTWRESGSECHWSRRYTDLLDGPNGWVGQGPRYARSRGRFPSIISGYARAVSANERRRCICNAYSRWLRRDSYDPRKQIWIRPWFPGIIVWCMRSASNTVTIIGSGDGLSPFSAPSHYMN